MEKILTIIIPTYNMEKYLSHCLDSLIVPNMDKVEVLVINDGSKDSSSVIAHEYQYKYPQTFRVIDKENGNYGSCINRGLKEAIGKYVKVLDADDSFDTNNFEKYITFLSTKDVDLILNDFLMVSEDGNVITKWVGHNIPQDKDFNFNVINPKCQMWMHAVAYKTDNLKQIQGGYHQTEGISYTDQEWIFLPMSTVKTVSYFNRFLYKYLTGREGQTISSKVFLKNVWMEAKGEMVMIDEYKCLPSETKNKEYLVNRLQSRLRVIYLNCIQHENQTSFNLREFDEWLKNNDQALYDYCDTISIEAPKISVKCPIVNLWRKNKLSSNMSYYVCKLYSKLHFILKHNPKGFTTDYFD